MIVDFIELNCLLFDCSSVVFVASIYIDFDDKICSRCQNLSALRFFTCACVARIDLMMKSAGDDKLFHNDLVES